MPILFSSSKLPKLKYILHYFFLKCLTKKSWCVLRSKKYGNLKVHGYTSMHNEQYSEKDELKNNSDSSTYMLPYNYITDESVAEVAGTEFM